MSIRPRHTKKDLNHAAILGECRALGMVAWDLADLGNEILDCIVFWRGMSLVVEIKSPGKEKNLTAGEAEGIRKLNAVGVYPVVVSCTEDIVARFKEMEEQCHTA